MPGGVAAGWMPSAAARRASATVSVDAVARPPGRWRGGGGGIAPGGGGRCRRCSGGPGLGSRDGVSCLGWCSRKVARLGAAGGSATPLGQAASPVLRLGRRCADSLPPRLLLPLRAAGAGGIRVPRASRLPVTPPAASAGAAVHLAERGQRLPRRRRLLRRQRRPLRVGQRRCAAKELPPRQTIRVAKLLLLLRPPLGRSPGGGAGQRAVKLVGRRRSQVGGAVMLRADCSLPAAAAAVQEAVGDGGAVRGRRRLRRRMRAAEGDARLVRGCAAACVPAVKNVIQETCLAA